MKHWVFDLDGTLVDSFSHFFVTLEKIFSEHEAKFSQALQHAALTEPLPEFFKQHLGVAAVPQAMATLQSDSNQDAAHIRPFENMLPALQQLSAQGARIAVWTNRDLTSARLILKQTGLDRFAEICVSGSCVTRRKPDPEGLIRILKFFDCESDTVTLVGDHEHDVMAAKSVGARAVRASWHSYWETEPCAYADAQFHAVKDFASWISEHRFNK